MANENNNTSGFNLNDIVNYINTIKDINSTIADTVGIDLLYFRAIPHENSESVIFHEYTLLDVDCQKSIKGVVKNPDYGNGIEVDLFGVKYDAPLQVQFDLKSWNSVFGDNVMPQKDDIVYVPVLNRLFEVATSSPIYTFINQQTAWQVDMVKYNPKASRAENQSLLDTLQETTTSEAILFGEEISNQIADITDITEFSPYNSVSKEGDWFKEVSDRSCIIDSEIKINGFLISNGYYNMDLDDIEKPSVIYKNSSDSISPDSKRPNRFFSVWFRPHYNNSKQHDLKEFKLYLKLKGTSQFKAICSGNYSIGQQVLVSKGSILRIPGTILNKDFKGNYLIETSTRDILAANKKISNWQSSEGLKIESTGGDIDLINGYQGFKISMIGFKTLKIQVGSFEKHIGLQKSLGNDWYGLGFNIGPQSVAKIFNSKGELIENLDFGKIIESINIEYYYLNSSPVDLSNIRLYEFESPVLDDNTIKEDLFRTFTTNANNAIIADKAEIPNYMEYLGKVR